MKLHRGEAFFINFLQQALPGCIFSSTHPPRLSEARSSLFHEAQLAGFLLSPRFFSKPSLSIEQQVALLQERGMQVNDLDKAKHYLRFIGYYRLSGYWYGFQYRDDSHEHDAFRPGTTFQGALDRYVFDRKLRSLTMDALERVEIAAKSAISDEMCSLGGSHWFCDPRYFDDEYDHDALLRLVLRETGIQPDNQSRRTQFVDSYTKNYDEPIEPPGWMTFEVLSFGTISKIYENLEREHQISISKKFELAADRLKSWLHAYAHIRNTCAHHSRVWNRTFRINPSVLKSEKDHVFAPKKFYNHAVAIQCMLNKVSGNHSWGLLLDDLLSQYPSIPLSPMGFPEDWIKKPIWN